MFKIYIYTYTEQQNENVNNPHLSVHTQTHTHQLSFIWLGFKRIFMANIFPILFCNIECEIDFSCLNEALSISTTTFFIFNFCVQLWLFFFLTKDIENLVCLLPIPQSKFKRSQHHKWTNCNCWWVRCILLLCSLCNHHHHHYFTISLKSATLRFSNSSVQIYEICGTYSTKQYHRVSKYTKYSAIHFWLYISKTESGLLTMNCYYYYYCVDFPSCLEPEK